MAERLKKNNGNNGVFLKNHQHHMRHGSVDDNPMMVI
jgi:hypothetical protein